MNETGMKDELPDEMGELIRINQNKYIDLRQSECRRTGRRYGKGR